MIAARCELGFAMLRARRYHQDNVFDLQPSLKVRSGLKCIKYHLPSWLTINLFVPRDLPQINTLGRFSARSLSRILPLRKSHRTVTSLCFPSRRAGAFVDPSKSNRNAFEYSCPQPGRRHAQHLFEDNPSV
jgi:hypothetical protein